MKGLLLQGVQNGDFFLEFGRSQGSGGGIHNEVFNNFRLFGRGVVIEIIPIIVVEERELVVWLPAGAGAPARDLTLYGAFSAVHDGGVMIGESLQERGGKSAL
ncbi:MAG: hypothetical protein M5U34_27310 [Chloroflexi bacterium]|nr:hypothetical protein [Chloroflexota bacterium]